MHEHRLARHAIANRAAGAAAFEHVGIARHDRPSPQI
jgi:hypothetical protein